MADLTLKCSDCKNGFTFTEKEQVFFHEKGFAPPKRCKGCRQAKKDRFNTRGNAQEYAPDGNRRQSEQPTQWISGGEQPPNPRKQHGSRRDRGQHWRRNDRSDYDE